MRKMLKVFLLITFTLFIQACSKPTESMQFSKKVYSGDAIFYTDSLILTSDGALMIVDTDSESITKFDEVKANWLDVLPDERLIVHAAFDKTVSLTTLDSNQIVKETVPILEGNDLRIDPTIFKIDNSYFITLTKIVGTVNNKDINIENGTYTIELYRSIDLQTWTKMNDILTAQQNIEDIDVLVKNGIVHLAYEQETYDRGPSSINVISSADKGNSWSQPITLIDKEADNEPAKLLDNDDGYILMYSSDESSKGTSYDGAKAYANIYDNHFNLTKHEILKTTIDHNMILYDTKSFKDKFQLLYVNDYSGDKNLHVDLIENSLK